jgi:hypothetical protein
MSRPPTPEPDESLGKIGDALGAAANGWYFYIRNHPGRALLLSVIIICVLAYLTR